MEYVNKYDYQVIVTLLKKNEAKLQEIKDSNKCLGDKAREILKQGITDNIVWARKMLEL